MMCKSQNLNIIALQKHCNQVIKTKKDSITLHRILLKSFSLKQLNLKYTIMFLKAIVMSRKALNNQI